MGISIAASLFSGVEIILFKKKWYSTTVRERSQ